MRFARWSLAIAAVALAGFGALLLVWPAALERVGVTTSSVSGVIELRAFYGGLELGLAAFFLLALRHPGWLPAALAVQVAAVGGVALARGVALALSDGAASPIIYLSWIGETAIATLGAVARTRLPKKPHGQ